jgi:hypothetical protein
VAWGETEHRAGVEAALDQLGDGAADLGGLAERRRVLAGHGGGAKVGGGRAGVEQGDAERGGRHLLRPALHEVVLRRLGRAVEAPIGARLLDTVVGEHEGAAGGGGAQERIGRADQAPAGGGVDGEALGPVLRHDVRDRRQLGQEAGGVDQDVEAAEALEDGGADHVELLGLLYEVERQQRGGAAGGADPVVGGFQPALGARRQHDMDAAGGERDRRGLPDAARGAGDEGDLHQASPPTKPAAQISREPRRGAAPARQRRVGTAKPRRRPKSAAASEALVPFRGSCMRSLATKKVFRARRARKAPERRRGLASPTGTPRQDIAPIRGPREICAAGCVG